MGKGLRAPLDAQVMYECTGRKAHGKFAMADGAIDSSEVQLSTNAHPSHTYTVRPSQIEVELRQELANFKHQRQEDCQSIQNALSEFNNQTKEVIPLFMMLYNCSLFLLQCERV